MSADEIEMIAADWLAREDRGLTVEERNRMELWLEHSSRHKVAYLRLKASWYRADRLAALKAPAPLLHPSKPRWIAPAAIAASFLVLAAGGAAWFWRTPAPSVQSYATAVGQRQALRLADGTQIELDTNTHLRADLNGKSRTVTLDSGEAFFDVVHDASRPFTVYAGNRRITDIGTKFSVFRDGDDVRVVVKEGQVKIEQIGQPQAVPLLAQAGHEIIAKGSETLLAGKPDQEISNDLSWRRGVLVFNQQTLADAAEQFNRYNNRHILVEGSARKIRIGGRFKADNVDVFVQLLHRGFGLSVNEQGDKIVVSR
ncbi:MAG TPA: FecR domain-containing protein [Rhizomicrobium sp.]|nr:FecR domain-containing protein [Rhizomicrobium sp.]